MKQQPQTDQKTDDMLDEELPPMAEDEEDVDFGGPVEDFLDEQRDDGMSWLDDSLGIEDYDDAVIADEIGALNGNDEPTWTDGSEADETLEGTEADLDFGEEYGWTEDSDVSSSEEWEDDLDMDLNDDGASSLLDDGGEEGLDDDLHDNEIDFSSWEDLGSDHEGDGFDNEDESFGLSFNTSFEQELRMSGELLPEPIEESLLKAAWLGPSNASAVSVIFHQDRLYAAGAGLFVPHGNELHRTESSSIIEDAQGTSVTIDPNDPSRIFIGSLLSGLFIGEDDGKNLTPQNLWVTKIHGCGTPESPSVPIRVDVGLSADGKTTLWVLTSEGDLLRSSNLGADWEPVLTQSRILAFSCDPQGPAVAALAEETDEIVVYWSENGDVFEHKSIPPLSTNLSETYDPRIAVRSRTVLVGEEELTEGLLYLSDIDGEWKILENCPRATAISVVGEPENPSIYAGLFFSGKDLGTLLRSTDQGESWSRICDVGRLGGLFPIDQIGVEDVTARIHDISFNFSYPNQVVLATGHGVFVIEMKDLT